MIHNIKHKSDRTATEEEGIVSEKVWQGVPGLAGEMIKQEEWQVQRPKTEENMFTREAESGC